MDETLIDLPLRNIDFFRIAQQAVTGTIRENISIKGAEIHFNSINFIVRGSITIRGLHSYLYVFKNCEFKTEAGSFAKIETSGVLSGLTLSNCKGHAISINTATSLLLNESHFESIDINNSEIKSLSNCNYKRLEIFHSKIDQFLIHKKEFENLILDKCTLFNKFTLRNSRFISVELHELNSENGSLLINGNQVESSIDIINSPSIKKCSISGTTGKLNLNSARIDNLNIYRNKSNINLQNCAIRFGKLHWNVKLELIALLNNEVSDELKIDNNSFDTISIESQDISKLSFSKNLGEVIIGDPRGEIFPTLSENQFSKIKIYRIANSERRYTFKLGELNSLEVDEVSISFLEILANRVERLIVTNCNLTQSELRIEISELNSGLISNSEITNVILSKSQVSHFEIANCNIGELQILDCTSSSVNLLKNQKIERVYITDNQFQEVDLTESNISQLNIKDSSCESLRFKQEVRATVNLDSKYSIQSIEVSNANRNKSRWFFHHDSLKQVNVSFSKEIKTLIINEELSNNQNHIEFIFDNTAINKLKGRINSSIYSFRCKYSSVNIEGIANQQEALPKMFKSENDEVNESIVFRKYSNGTIHFENLATKDFSIDKGDINSLKILNSPSEESRPVIEKISISPNSLISLDINDIKTNRLELDGFQPRSLEINRSTISNLKFNDFRLSKDGKPKGVELSFINTDRSLEAGVLAFKNSNLDGFNLNSCYFDSFQELEVYSSKLDQVYCTATTWPEKVVSYEDDSKNKLQQFEIREACRQLKLAMADHHDRISELQFHSLEMEAYRKIILERKSWRLANDILSLLGGLTNNFGANWIRPLFLAFVSMTIVYTGMICDHHKTFPLSEDFKYFFNWVDYFQLYNPTHRLNQLNLGGTISGLTASLDFLSRILSAFFIYQVAAAFRKFRK